MLKKHLLSSIVLASVALVPSTEAATILGLHVSASAWSPDISGTIDNTGPEIDLNDTLGYSDEDLQRLSVRLEHPIPVLPNIGLEQYDMDSAAVATLTETITYDGTIYNINDTVNSQLDLSHQSVLLYYEILDNWITLDLGLDIMLFDGLIALESTNSSNTTSLDETIPALYGLVQFEFPTTNITAGASLSYISYDDNDITKGRVYVGWATDLGLGLEVGVQSFDAEWQDINESNGNLTFDGVYTSLTYNF